MEFLINNLSVAEYPLRRSATLSLDAVDDLKEYLSRHPETLVFVNAFQDGLGKSYQEEDLSVLRTLTEIKRIFLRSTLLIIFLVSIICMALRN
jgi:hypothetical protein